MLCSFIAFDYWNNASHYYLRSGDKPDSRLEIYQGKLGSPDFFHQHKFIMETPYLRKQFEPDKCIKQCAIEDYQHILNEEISNLPLQGRILAYIDDGQFDNAFDLIDRTLKSNNVQNSLGAIKKLAKININATLPKLIEELQNNPSSTVRTAIRENMPIVATQTLFNTHDFNKWEQLKNRDIISYLTLHPDWLRNIDDWFLFRMLVMEYTADENIYYKGSDLAFQIFIAASGDVRSRVFLQNALDDEYDDVKRGATLALGQIKDIEAIPALINKLSDKNFDIKENAIKALIAMGTEDIAKRLIKKLTENKATEAHVKVLASIHSPLSLQALISVLGNDDIGIRRYAVEGIYNMAKVGIRSEKSIQPLILRLNDNFDENQAYAAHALVELNVEEAIEPLIKNLSHKYGYTRSSAACALGDLKATQAIPFLLEALNDAAPLGSKDCAADAIKKINSTEAIQTIIANLKHDDVKIRTNMAEALVKIKTPKAIQPLIEALADEEPKVRRFAAEALGEMKSSQAIPFLIRLLQDEDSLVRGFAARAIGQIKSDRAIQPLIELLSDESDFPRREATTSLGILNAAQAIKPIQTRLNDEDFYVRQAAIGALGELKAHESIQSLMAHLSEEPNIAKSLGILKAKEATQSLLQALSSTNDNKRYGAAMALGKIGSLKSLEPLLFHIYDRDTNDESRKSLLKLATENDFKWLVKWLEQFTPLPLKSPAKPSSKTPYEKKSEESFASKIMHSTPQQLIEQINDSGRLRAERIMGLEMLVKKKPELAKKTLLALLKNKENKAIFAHRLYQLLGEMKVTEALPIIQQDLSKLKVEWQEWRKRQDNLTDKDKQKEIPEAIKPKPVVSAYTYAEAIARINPKQGIKLLQHELYEARRGAWEGLARLADVDLLKKLNKLRAENKRNPILRHALYRAIDLSLLYIDANSHKKDCQALDSYLNMLDKNQQGIKSHDPVFLRIKWTRDRIDETLESINRSKWRIKNWSKPTWTRETYQYSHCYNR